MRSNVQDRLTHLLFPLLVLAGCASPPHRTRVLYVESAPRWEYRYLARALVRDASLDVQCFLLSASSEFPQAHSEKSDSPKFQAPLAALPSTMEELLEYDVVILGDVGPEAWPAGAAGRLKEFVSERGRGVVILAGEQRMPDGWKGTELDAVLPVESVEQPPGATGETGYRLTEAGRRSPLVAFAADESGATELWEDRDGGGDGLPGIDWAVETRCRPGAETLIETGAAGHRVPLFVTIASGKGRVFFSATDETWRWRFRTGDQPWFAPFWRGVIGWAGKE